MMFIINICIALGIAIVIVQYNRGQILEMPDWKLIPRCVSDCILFMCAFIYSWNYIQRMEWDEVNKVLFNISVMVWGAIFGVIFIVMLVPLIKKDRDALTEENVHKKELLGYFLYTTSYFGRYFILIYIIENIVVDVVALFEGIGSKIPGLDNWDTVCTPVCYIGTIYIMVLCIIATLSCIFDSCMCGKVRRQKNKISQVKEYLSSKITQN